MTLVAIVPKILVRNLFFLLLKLGSIKLFHFVKDCRLSGYNNLFAGLSQKKLEES